MHVIGTAGHVDHGKSTLVQRLTGMDPDRWAEEKRRGLTIDLGFAWFELPSGRSVGIVDVPGHERFIANMLAGAGGIGACLFVVAANEGWMPQSAEHLAILDLLEVSHGVVALTKSDLVEPGQLGDIVDAVTDRLSNTCLSEAPVIACSATTGDGMDELIAALDRVLEAAGEAVDEKRPRLWVDRSFTIAGAGTVVTGTTAGGGFVVGDEIEIAPAGARARIRGMQSHDRSVESIGPGRRVALNLGGVERWQVDRGNAVVRSGQWAITPRVDALVRVPEAWDGLLQDRGSHHLHVGSAESPARLKLLDAEEVGPGESGIAQLYLRDPLPMKRGDRFVLRDAGRRMTVGGGEVLDPDPPIARKGRTEHIERVSGLAGIGPDQALDRIVEAEGKVEASRARLRTALDAVPERARALGPSLVSETWLRERRSALLERLDTFHASEPLKKGLARETLRSELQLDAETFDALIESIEEIATSGPLVAQRTHAVALSPEQEAQRRHALELLRAGGFAPPHAADLGVPAALLRALVERGDIVPVGDFYLESGVANEGRAAVRRAIEDSGPVTVAQIRDLLGTTRKYAVPLCEWLDNTGATIRRGDLRHLGPKA